MTMAILREELNNNKYYNTNFKDLYLEYLIKKGIETKSANYSKTLDKIFRDSKEFEIKYNKDLYSFDTSELLEFYNKIAYDKKYMVVTNNNYLVKEYKQWSKTMGVANVNLDICSTTQLKKINHYKEYTILNDDDIDSLTWYSEMYGSDYNCAILLRIYWDIDARESVEDILKLRIDDVNFDNDTVIINNHSYKMHKETMFMIEDFAFMDKLIFKNKRGSYKILTAEENHGYIFRTAFNVNTVVGEPMLIKVFSNLLCQYSNRNEVSICTHDITMSLALKYMLIHKKTHCEMSTEKRYFTNLLSTVYRGVFEKDAKEKFPKLYNEFVEYFDKLEKSLKI